VNNGKKKVNLTRLYTLSEGWVTKPKLHKAIAAKYEDWNMRLKLLRSECEIVKASLQSKDKDLVALNAAFKDLNKKFKAVMKEIQKVQKTFTKKRDEIQTKLLFVIDTVESSNRTLLDATRENSRKIKEALEHSRARLNEVVRFGDECEQQLRFLSQELAKLLLPQSVDDCAEISQDLKDRLEEIHRTSLDIVVDESARLSATIAAGLAATTSGASAAITASPTASGSSASASTAASAAVSGASSSVTSGAPGSATSAELGSAPSAALSSTPSITPSGAASAAPSSSASTTASSAASAVSLAAAPTAGASTTAALGASAALLSIASVSPNPAASTSNGLASAATSANRASIFNPAGIKASLTLLRDRCTASVKLIDLVTANVQKAFPEPSASSSGVVSLSSAASARATSQLASIAGGAGEFKERMEVKTN
jgi:hypothetical protein